MKLLAVVVVVLVYLELNAHAAETAKQAKRLSIIRPPPRPITRVYLPGFNIDAGQFNPNMSYGYCFRRKCRVLGMYNGFKGWMANQTNKKGYYAYNGILYIIYRCDGRRYGRG